MAKEQECLLCGIKTLKTAVIHDVTNRTCCMVDWNDPRGGAFALYFRPHRWAFDSLNTPSPRKFAIHKVKKKKGKFPGVSPEGGGGGGEGRAQLELTGA